MIKNKKRYSIRRKFMKKTNKIALFVGILGAIATVASAIITSNYTEQKIFKKLQGSVGEVSGDNNNVTINDVNDIVKDYQGVKELNKQYATQLEKNADELKQLKTQLGDTPIFKFNDLDLTVDGEEIPIDAANSMVTIDGREYLDKSFVDNILGTNRSLTIKDKTSLNDSWLVDSNYVNFPDSITDSFGDMHTNAITFSSYEPYAVFNLKEDFNLFSCRIAASEDSDSEFVGRIVIKADDKTVYTSPEFSKTTKPFVKKDIPVKNCSLLKIEFHNESGGECIISDAFAYN